MTPAKVTGSNDVLNEKTIRAGPGGDFGLIRKREPGALPGLTCPVLDNGVDNVGMGRARCRHGSTSLGVPVKHISLDPAKGVQILAHPF